MNLESLKKMHPIALLIAHNYNHQGIAILVKIYTALKYMYSILIPFIMGSLKYVIGTFSLYETRTNTL